MEIITLILAKPVLIAITLAVLLLLTLGASRLKNILFSIFSKLRKIKIGPAEAEFGESKVDTTIERRQSISRDNIANDIITTSCTIISTILNYTEIKQKVKEEFINEQYTNAKNFFNLLQTQYLKQIRFEQGVEQKEQDLKIISLVLSNVFNDAIKEIELIVHRNHLTSKTNDQINNEISLIYEQLKNDIELNILCLKSNLDEKTFNYITSNIITTEVNVKEEIKKIIYNIVNNSKEMHTKTKEAMSIKLNKIIDMIIMEFPYIDENKLREKLENSLKTINS